MRQARHSHLCDTWLAGLLCLPLPTAGKAGLSPSSTGKEGGPYREKCLWLQVIEANSTQKRCLQLHFLQAIPAMRHRRVQAAVRLPQLCRGNCGLCNVCAAFASRLPPARLYKQDSGARVSRTTQVKGLASASHRHQRQARLRLSHVLL